MNKLLCIFAVSASVVLSGLAFAHDSSLEHKHRGDVKNKAIEVGGDIGLPGIYLWNLTGGDNVSGLTCGLYIMNIGHALSAGAIGQGEPLTLEFPYTYDESTFMLAGELTVSRCDSLEPVGTPCSDWGEPVTLRIGDLININNGDRILWSTTGFGKAYYCANSFGPFN